MPRASIAPLWILLATSTGCGAGEDLGAPIVGVLEVTTVTANPSTEPGNYAVLVNGVSHPVGPNDILTLSGLTAADYTLELRGVPGSCTTSGRNPRFASVAPSATTRVDFQISCAAPAALASLAVRVVTVGSAPDPDGYSLLVDAAPARTVGTNDHVVLADLPEGIHALRLAGIAPSCEVRDSNPRSIEVPRTAETRFEVTCVPPITDVILYTSDRSDEDGADMDIFLRAPDGTLLRNLTNTPDFDEREPVWSPDGGQIAFVPFGGEPGMAVMDADGGSRRPLAGGSLGGRGLQWSPDGSRLLFESGDLNTYSFSSDRAQVLVPEPENGSLTGYCWSPDGTRVAYSIDHFGSDPAVGTVYTVSATGGPATAVVTVIERELTVQAWSPDGGTIAYLQEEPDGRNDIYLVRADGSGSPSNLTNNPGSYGDVTWSPDGRTLAFGNEGVFSITTDGVLRQLTQDDGEELVWSRDGSRLLYMDGFELYIINFDGTGRRAVTADDFLNSQASWRP